MISLLILNPHQLLIFSFLTLIYRLHDNLTPFVLDLQLYYIDCWLSFWSLRCVWVYEYYVSSSSSSSLLLSVIIFMIVIIDYRHHWLSSSSSLLSVITLMIIIIDYRHHHQWVSIFSIFTIQKYNSESEKDKSTGDSEGFNFMLFS